jgi:hypothetical protein
LSEKFCDDGGYEGVKEFLEEQVGDVVHVFMVRVRGVAATGEPRGLFV